MKPKYFVFSIFILLLVAQSAIGHVFLFVDTGIFVEKNRITAVVKVFTEAFMWQYNLIPDKHGYISAKDIKESAEKYKKVIFQDLIISKPSSRPYFPAKVELESFDVPEKGIQTIDLPKKYARYVVTYNIKSPPDRLSFQQIFGFAECIPSVMTVELSREGVPSENSTFELESNIKTFEFDWSYKEKRLFTLKDWLHKNKITPPNVSKKGLSDGLYPFIYINDYQVRIEIMATMKFVNRLFKLNYKSKDILKPEDTKKIKDKMLKWFESKNKVKLDGICVSPVLKPLAFFAGTSFKTIAGDIPIASSSVGAIFTFSTKGAPERFELNWNIFPKSNKSVRAIIFPYDKSFSKIFTPPKNNYIWKRTSTNKSKTKKIASVQFTSGITKDEAKIIVKSLLKNVYRAFDYSSESDIYDTLANSVTDELLKQTYLAIKQSLIMQSQGGGISKVQEVKIINSKIPDSSFKKNAFDADITWTVRGYIEHWGHTHYRLNQYHARFHVSKDKSSWKIKSLDIQSAKCLQTYYSSRRVLKK